MHDFVRHFSGGNDAGPPHQQRNAIRAFTTPAGADAKRRRADVDAAGALRSRSTRVQHDGVIGQSALVEKVEQLADDAVVLLHRGRGARHSAAG